MSAMLDTTFMLCSTISTVRPAATFLISSVTRATSSWPMPWVGSSSNISSGSVASVVAISSARLRPYGSETVWRWQRPQVDLVEQVQRAPVHRLQHPLAAPELERHPGRPLQRDADVFQHREVREHRRDLVGAHDAAAGDVLGRLARDVDAVEQDASACRRQELRQQVEAGGLARAVGADQRVDCATPHLQARPR